MIDEAQDLTKLNYEIFSMLKSIIPELKILLVGDPRQNIFNFSGGSYEHLDNFLRKYPNHIQEKLTMTYRCPETVTEYLNNFRFNDCPNYKLKSMNDIAYVRFASVYREFKDVNTFLDELNSMLHQKDK